MCSARPQAEEEALARLAGGDAAAEQIEIPLQGALSMENIRVSVPSVFTVTIGPDTGAMTNAAVRLLGLQTRDIMKQAEDIIFGQLRQVIASMRIEEINRDRDDRRSSGRCSRWRPSCPPLRSTLASDSSLPDVSACPGVARRP